MRVGNLNCMSGYWSSKASKNDLCTTKVALYQKHFSKECFLFNNLQKNFFAKLNIVATVAVLMPQTCVLRG